MFNPNSASLAASLVTIASNNFAANSAELSMVS
ncbi:hypothetical protein GECvBBS_gp051c [Salmonella phage GEC_vB_BS]|uniref:Uncharacterized protein n=3 Tax=Felixounavirus mushroom TaxID=1965380 RepID=A0A7S9XDF7_9CAUD|nr:hypothetical protein GECvBB1_gp051c [Salmonella phage GEC_vB_B1]QPI14240.1 hypothetical protein GECvBBS_gp051c [Salmonella phage GEC_vB_BS]QPI15686.1 hypothetical protein GECvBNS7_gp051c [Salmonella phage GEC_vB_NS7]